MILLRLSILACLSAISALVWAWADSASEQSQFSATSAGVSSATLTVTLSANAASDSVAAASDFAVSENGTAVTVSTASVSGSALTLILASAVADVDCSSGQVTVGYTRSASSITDSGGAQLANFTALAATNTTDAAPAVKSIATNVDGTRIVITFCEDLASIDWWNNVTAFAISTSQSKPAISDVEFGTNTVTIKLTNKKNGEIRQGESVTLAYNSSSADDGKELRDKDQGGKLVASWSARTVTNNVDSPPGLVSVTALWDVITLTYSETLNEDSVPNKSAFMISDTPYSVEIESVAVSGKTVTLATSYVIRGELSPQFTLRYTAPDDSPLQQADGKKDAPNFHSQEVVSSTPTTKPVFQSAAVSGTTLTITFDLPLKNVAGASAFAVGGVTGVSVSSTSFSGKVVTLTLSSAVSASDTVTIAYTKPNAPPRIEARNIKDADTFTAKTVTNNTVNPAPTFSSASINAAGHTLTITMSKNLLTTDAGTPTKSAFTISGGSAAISVVAVSGKTVRLTLSPKADHGETITIAYNKPTGADDGKLQSQTGGHLVASWSAQSVTNGADGKPRPQSASVNGTALTITFDRTLDAASLPVKTDFSINGTSSSVSSVAISGSTATLTLNTAVAHDATITVSYTKPGTGGLKRSGKSIYADSFTTFSVTNNTPDPTPTFSSASINAAGDTLTITMTKDLLTTDAGKPDKSAFTITGGSGAITAVAVSGKKVSLTLSPKADHGQTITIAYTKPTGANDGKLQSATGSHLVASWTVQSVTNGADGKPRPTSAAVNGTTLAITFDRALDTGSVPAKTTFTINGTSVTVSSVAISGSTATLTLSAAVAHDATITVSYAKPNSDGLKRSGKNIFADSFDTLAVTNSTPDPTPTFASASINTAGDTLAITMSKDLLTTSSGTPAVSAFTISGGTAAITAVAVSGKTVSLTLSPKADEGETITIAYTKPTGANDGKLQSETGDHIVASWTAQSVTNNTDGKPRPQSATANGTMLAITFDRALDSASVPTKTDFTINGTTATTSSVAISGSTTTLTLNAAVAHDATITVDYAKPNSGGLKRSGKEIYADSFTALKVTNSTPDPTPRFTSATIDATGRTLTVTMSHALLETSNGIPATSTFTIGGTTSAAISSIAVKSTKVTVALSPAADLDETVTLSYTPPTNVADSRLQSAQGGQSTPAWSVQPVTNNADGVPRPLTATANATLLALTFDRQLDATAVPPASEFSVTPTGHTISTVAVAGGRVTLTLSPAFEDADQVTVSYAASDAVKLKRDSQALTVATFSAMEVVNQTPAPLIRSVVGDEQSIVVTFSTALNQSSVPPAPAFSLGADQSTVASVSISGSKLSLTLRTALQEDAAYTLSYTVPDSSPLQKADGASIPAFTKSITNNTDTAPVPVLGTVEDDTITIILDQEIYDDSRFKLPAGYPSDHFSLTGTDATMRFILVSNSAPGSVGKIVITLSSPVVEGAALTLTYSPISGTIRIRDDDDGQNRVEINSYSLTNLTDYPPTVKSAEVDGETLMVIFDQPLDPASNPVETAYSLSDNGPAIHSSEISESVLTLTLAQTAVEDVGYKLTYTPPESDGLRDLTGNLVAAITDEPVKNNTDYAPYPTTVEAKAEGQAPGADIVRLKFDQPISQGGTIDPAWFSFEPTLPIRSVVDDDSRSEGDRLKIELGTDTWIREGTAVSLTYTPPPTGGLQDGTGNQVVGFTKSVVNLVNVAPVVKRITATGYSILIEFDQDLDSEYVPPANCEELERPEKDFDCDDHPDLVWFEVLRNDGPSINIQSVSLVGKVVTLTLSEAARQNDSISVQYSSQSLPQAVCDQLGDCKHNLQDISSAGNPVVGFGPNTADNLTAAAPRSADINRTMPEKLNITFDSQLQSEAEVDTSAMQVAVNGTPATISSATSKDATLTLNFSSDIPECAHVTFSYYASDGSWQDAQGYAIQTIRSFPVANLIGSAWGLKCVESDRGHIILTFAEDHIPDKDGWGLTVNGESRESNPSILDNTVTLMPTPSVCLEDIHRSVLSRDGRITEAQPHHLVSCPLRRISHRRPHGHGNYLRSVSWQHLTDSHRLHAHWKHKHRSGDRHHRLSPHASTERARPPRV